MKTQPNTSSSRRRRSAEAVDRSQDPSDNSSNIYCCGPFLGHAFGDLCFAFQLLCWAANCSKK